MVSFAVRYETARRMIDARLPTNRCQPTRWVTAPTRNPMSPSWDGKLEQCPTVEPNIKDNKLSLRRTEAFPSRPQPNR